MKIYSNNIFTASQRVQLSFLWTILGELQFWSMDADEEILLQDIMNEFMSWNQNHPEGFGYEIPAENIPHILNRLIYQWGHELGIDGYFE